MKSVYVVSALQFDSNHLGNLKKFDNEKDAVDHAKNIVQRRMRQGDPNLEFFVLKTVAGIHIEPQPVTVYKMK